MTQQPQQPAAGRQQYGPQLLTVARLGNPMYGLKYAFVETQGFFSPPQDQPTMQLVVGQQYMVVWTEKPNPPNNPYLDIVSAVLPDGQIPRYDPQGTMVPGTPGPQVTPEQTASWGETPPQGGAQPVYDDPLGPGPQPTEAAPVLRRDPTRESIEKQVAVKETGAMLVAISAAGAGNILVFTTEQTDWLQRLWLDGVYELWNGTPPPVTEQPDDNT